MLPKVSVFIATSLDGYIARENGDLDWLDDANTTVPEGEDYGFAAFMATVDMLVMGRKTYEQVLAFGEWPYGDTPITVMSRKPVELPDNVPKTVTHSSESPQELCDRLELNGIRHIYVDGGNTVQRFLSAKLVDEITLSIIPILLGSGIPLFSSQYSDVKLSCLETKQYDSGIIQLKYRIKNNVSNA